MRKITVAALVVATLNIFYAYRVYKRNQRHPITFPDDIAWGRTESDSSIVEPFEVEFPSDLVDDVAERLRKWRGFHAISDQYGFSDRRLEELVNQWQSYNFTKSEKRLNEHPQFTTVIQNLNIHFIHARADVEATTTHYLLLLHGWPFSSLEFNRLISLLTKPDENGVAFHVIAPSIPGFGFSEAPAKPGFSALAAAQLFETLMNRRLAIDRFIIHGSDWGSVIGQLMARIYPDSVIGLHVDSMPLKATNLREKIFLSVANIAPNFLLRADLVGLKQVESLWDYPSMLEGQMAEAPDTFSVALTDSPIGLLAFLAEQFDLGGGFNEEEELSEVLLDNVMVSWFSQSFASSARFYKEFYHQSSIIEGWNNLPINVPMGISCSRKAACAPESFLRLYKTPKLVHYLSNQGGRFEVPERLSQNFRQAASKFLFHDAKWK